MTSNKEAKDTGRKASSREGLARKNAAENFDEQAVLLKYAPEILKYKRAVEREKPDTFKTEKIMEIDLRPEECANIFNLMKFEEVNGFLSALPADYGYLVPMIKFYVPNENGEDELIYFSEYSLGPDKGVVPIGSNDQGIYSSAGAKGANGGIISFNFDESQANFGFKAFQGNLVLSFASLRDFRESRYVNLIDPRDSSERTDRARNNTQQKKKTSELEQQLQAIEAEAVSNKNRDIEARKNPTIKAVVGWADPNTANSAAPKNTALYNFVRNSRKTLILILTRYKVDFQQNGQTRLDLNFYASLENDLKRSSADVFAQKRPQAEDEATIELTQIKAKTISALRNAEFRNGKVKLEVKKKLDDVPDVKKDTPTPYLKITEEAIDRDLRRLGILKKAAQTEKKKQEEARIDDTEEFLRDLLTRVKFQTTGKKRRVLLNKLTGKTRRESGTISQKLFEFVVPGQEIGLGYRVNQLVKPYKFDKPRTVEETKRKTVPFLFLRDIIDVAAEVGMGEKGNVILGTVPAVGFPRNRMSIGDIPIALDTFTSWFNQIVGDPDRMVLPFHLFLSKMLDILAQSQKNKSAASGWTQGGLPALSYNFITLSKRHFAKLKPGAKLKRGDVLTSDRSASKTPTNSEVSSGDRVDIIYVTSRNAPKAGDLTANYEKDLRRGIYHFMVGADRGPLLSINFTEMTNQHYATHQIMNARSKATDIVEELAMPQDVTMTLKGNNLLNTNNMIYVNATLGLGREVADQLRLGGYYRVHTVQQSFSAQGWTTDVAAKWQRKASRDGD